MKMRNKKWIRGLAIAASVLRASEMVEVHGVELWNQVNAQSVLSIGQSNIFLILALIRDMGLALTSLTM